MVVLHKTEWHCWIIVYYIWRKKAIIFSSQSDQQNDLQRHLHAHSRSRCGRVNKNLGSCSKPKEFSPVQNASTVHAIHLIGIL